MATVEELFEFISKEFPALLIEAVTLSDELLIRLMTSPIVVAELNVTVPEAEPFTMLI
jgi:hypothetical protein